MTFRRSSQKPIPPITQLESMRLAKKIVAQLGELIPVTERAQTVRDIYDCLEEDLEVIRQKDAPHAR